MPVLRRKTRRNRAGHTVRLRSRVRSPSLLWQQLRVSQFGRPNIHNRSPLSPSPNHSHSRGLLHRRRQLPSSSPQYCRRPTLRQVPSLRPVRALSQRRRLYLRRRKRRIGLRLRHHHLLREVARGLTLLSLQILRYRRQTPFPNRNHCLNGNARTREPVPCIVRYLRRNHCRRYR